MNNKKLPLRNGVGVIILNKNNQVFVAKRKDNPVDRWQMPQGGIDPGETAVDACMREMAEEIGTSSAQLLCEHSEWLYYDIPLPLADRLWHGQYKGQKQKWMLLRYNGADADINIETAEPEFCEWKWLPPDKLIDLAVPFKRDVYRHILTVFKPHIEQAQVITAK